MSSNNNSNHKTDCRTSDDASYDLGLRYDLTARTVAHTELHLKHQRCGNGDAIVSRKEVAPVLGSFVFLNYAYPAAFSG
jgi:hypothetical protein